MFGNRLKLNITRHTLLNRGHMVVKASFCGFSQTFVGEMVEVKYRVIHLVWGKLRQNTVCGCNMKCGKV